MRYSKQLTLFSRPIRGSEDQAVQIFCGIDQAVEGALILRFGNGRLVEIDICFKE